MNYGIKYINSSALQKVSFPEWFDTLAIKKSSEDEVTNVRDKAGAVIAEYNPKEFALSHFTAMPSVNLEKGSDYKITPQSSGFLNSNGDSWSSDLLKLKYKDFNS